MSVDEDTELRDLVAQTLESNGVLGKIRAQLRSSVFLALEEQDAIKNKTPYLNHDFKKFTSTKEGKLVTSLVREFLEYFHLDYTLAVFDPETSMQKDAENRSSLAREYDIIESSSTSNLPIIAEVIKRGRDPANRGRISSSTDNNMSDIDEKKNGIHLDMKTTSQSSDDSRGMFTDLKDDEFFDDPFPNNSVPKSAFGSEGKKSPEERVGGTGLTSLADLPSLGNSTRSQQSESETPRMAHVDLEDVKSNDKRGQDLGFDYADYDEDFESSNASPRGITPRSARSDQNIKSFEDEIEEDIEEELSVGEDLLKSDNSGLDDLTTDRTVSPTDQNNAFDYVEEVIS